MKPGGKIGPPQCPRVFARPSAFAAALQGALRALFLLASGAAPLCIAPGSMVTIFVSHDTGSSLSTKGRDDRTAGGFRIARMNLRSSAVSNLQDVTLAGDERVENGGQEDGEQQARKQAADNHIANGFCESLPILVDMAAGNKPRHATSAVMRMERKRSNEASYVAIRIFFPSRRSLLINE